MSSMTTPSIGANGGAMPALADDLLHGAKAISQFIYGNVDDANVRRIYHAADKLGMPTFRMGSTICARRSTIMRWIAAQEAA